MLQNLYNENIVIYAFAGLGAFGLLLRLIVNLVYKHLMKESDQLGETKNKMLKHIKLKFSTCYKLKIGVNNVDTFVDKNILKYRFCGLLLSTWENLCGQVLYLILLMVPIITVFAVLEECGQDIILLTGAVGILSAAVLILVDKSINLSGKKRIVRLNLLDYLENFCKVRLEQEASNPELIEQYRQEYSQVTEVHNSKPKAGVFSNKRTETAATMEVQQQDRTRDELNHRREAKQKKLEEKRLQAERREEEQRRLQEQRRAEEQRRLEEKREQAARRREEERLKLEEEREALEARRAQLKKKAEQKQLINDGKHRLKDEDEDILQSIEEELRPARARSTMEAVLAGAEEIAAAKEKEAQTRMVKEEQGKLESSRPTKAPSSKQRTLKIDPQEEKLIEDVLKEFFA